MGGVAYETWSHMEPWRFNCYIEKKTLDDITLSQK